MSGREWWCGNYSYEKIEVEQVFPVKITPKSIWLDGRCSAANYARRMPTDAECLHESREEALQYARDKAASHVKALRDKIDRIANELKRVAGL